MFKEDLERTIGKILKEEKYNAVHIAKNCTYYMKRYSDKLAFYIRCSDNRHHNGGISVQMFFTAIQVPDDRLITFGVGLNMHIVTVYSDITDEVVIAAGKKLLQLRRISEI